MARWITFDEALVEDARFATPKVTAIRPCALNMDGYGKFWPRGLTGIDGKPVMGIQFSDNTIVIGDAATLHAQLGGEQQAEAAPLMRPTEK